MREKTRQLLALLFVFVCFQVGDVHAEPARQDYDYVVNNLFWGNLYAQGGWSLYCGYRFGRDRKTDDGKAVSVGHIYAVDWILEAVDCASRLECFDKDNRAFMEMEADMHNMYPVWHELVTLRNDRSFGMVEGEQWRFSDCDFEWRLNVAEPREIARGNVARAIFYMHTTYELPIDPERLTTLKEWHRQDPPSRQEEYRNDRIEELQERRNPYIDEPALARTLHEVARSGGD